jgi:hypothetical protein
MNINNNQDLNELSECRELGNDNNKNNNNQYSSSSSSPSQRYYIGAYCNSKGVFVGTFTDSTCTQHAPSGTYETYSGGTSLPTTALVTYSECLSCKENNNADNADQVMDVCEQLYEEAAKCETNVQGASFPDVSGCDYMHSTLPTLNRAVTNSANKNAPTASASATVAWLFGATIVAMGAYIVYMHKKYGTKVKLSDMGGTLV